MKKSKKLVFFGTEHFSVPGLQKLIDGGWPVAAVVTKPDFRAGRGQKLTEPAVKLLAKRHGLAVWQPDSLPQISHRLAELRPDLGVLVAYGKIIPQAVIELFPKGIVNVHPSLLPQYRGPSPIETAILNGDRQTGLSIMALTAGLDEGPLYAQKKIKVPADTDGPAFSRYLAAAGADLLIDTLPGVLNGSIEPKAQDNSMATYTKLLKKEDGHINWHRPAIQLERQVRAFLAWPRSRAKVFGHEIIITKARVAKNQTDGALVMKANPGYLEILQLIAPSGKQMSGGDFKRGYLA